jgi:hypothetical protein
MITFFHVCGKSHLNYNVSYVCGKCHKKCFSNLVVTTTMKSSFVVDEMVNEPKLTFEMA